MVRQLNLLGVVLTDSTYVIGRKALAKLLDCKPSNQKATVGTGREVKSHRKIHSRLQVESEAHHRLIRIQVGEHLDIRAYQNPESAAGAGIPKT